MNDPMSCFRLLADSDKGSRLLTAVEAIRDGVGDSVVTWTHPDQFKKIPTSPFAYWVSEPYRRLFSTLPAFESEGRRVVGGLKTMRDERFVRAWWEVDPHSIHETGWARFAKGGAFSPFYLRLSLVVDWRHQGQDISWFSYQRRPREGFGASSRGIDDYFKPALTWPLRASAFSPQVLPAGCIFSNRSNVAIAGKRELMWLLGLMASEPFDFLFKTLLGRFGFPEFIVGTLQVLPMPKADSDSRDSLARLALDAWEIGRSGDAVHDTSPYFESPSSFLSSARTIAGLAASWQEQREVDEIAAETTCQKIDDIAFELFEIGPTDRIGLTSKVPVESEGRGENEQNDNGRQAIDPGDACGLASALLLYSVGSVFGRWDIRYATGERQAPELPDPFAPLPVCPPGMLQGDDGLPLSPEAGRRLRAEDRYPLDVAWDGILVDDPEHPLDLVRQVRTTLAVLWGDRVGALEHEACALLGVPTLRGWFRRPAGCFAEHLKRYSKSRRKAPIYWPLSTASGSYTIWLYYHRLTADTLFQLVAEYLEPKLRKTREERLHIEAGQAKAEGRESANLAKQAAELTALEQELEEMKDELLRVAGLPYRPDLNDGVQITASPLWKLFRLPQWRKALETTWKKLEKGEYDWAHLAYAIWPDRVREKCKTDRSLAIAHGLEDICEVEVKPKKNRRKKSNV